MAGRGASSLSVGAFSSASSKGLGSGARSIAASSVSKSIGRGGLAKSIGRDGSKISSELTVAGWEQMSRYNPYISSGATAEGDLNGYWIRDLKSAGSTITISVTLDKEAIGGETVTWASDGDAVEDIHWTTTSAKTVTLITGQKSFDVLITPSESGKWYRERTTKLRLSATGLRVHQEQGFVHLTFNSSAIPPLLVLTGPASAPSGATPITLTVTASYPPQDSIVLHAEFDAAGISNYTISGLGSVVIAASASNKVGTFTVTQIPGSSGSGDLIVNLVYERRGIAFVEHDYDTSLNTFTVPRDAHLDQNLWHQSNDISSVWQIGPTAEPIRPLTPGHPSSHEGGGAFSWNDQLGEATGIPQGATVDPKLLDPITGNELKLFHPNYNVYQGMSYIREGFESSFGGGAVTAHEIRKFIMTRWYFKEMVGADEPRNAEFSHVRVRLRNSNRNHGITFRFSHKIDSSWDGTDTDKDGWLKRYDGSAAVVAGRGGYDHSYTFASGLKVWEYSKYNGHEDSDQGWGTYYGAGEDSNGTYLWYLHQTNSNQSYAVTTVGAETAHTGTSSAADAGWWIIVPGKSYPNPAAATVPIYREYSATDTPVSYQEAASGNPIEYPIWVGSADLSANVKTDLDSSGDVIDHYTNRLTYIRNNGIGVLMHSMQFSMSDSQIPVPNATTGRFWPCEKSGWDPQGLAVIEDSGTAHKHTVAISS